MTLQRARLLARLLSSEPRLLRLCAPAGYGKSSLARLLAARFERHAICDCAGAAGLIAFADRVLAALAGESHPGGDAITAIRLRLYLTEADAASWSRALLDAWKARPEHALLILEHAETVADDPEILALLGDLFAARPPERVVLISTRSALPLRLAHYLAPHQTLTLAAAELCFQPAEAASIFAGADVPAEFGARIVELADGCPVVLLMLTLFAQYDGNVEKLLDALGAIPPAGLYEHLANDVLAAFTPEMMATMLSIAAIPSASLEDILAATGIRHATPIIDRLQRLPGFISSDKGAYSAHPRVSDALRAQRPAEMTAHLFRAAREYQRSGDWLRAAELFNAYGDEEAAAVALDQLPPAELAHPAARVVDVLVKIGMPTLCRHPSLWIATLPERRRCVATGTLYDEGRRLLRSFAPDAGSPLVRRLRVRLAMLAQERGALTEALELLAGPPEAAGAAPEERRYVLITGALVAAKQGRFADADRLVDEADAVHGARHLRFDAERAQIALAKALALGDWNGALELSEEALCASQRNGALSRIVTAAQGVADAAWFCNDDTREASACRLLEDCGAEPRAARWRSVPTSDAEGARDHFDAAIAEVDGGEDDLLRVVVRVHAALHVPRERARLLEARAIATRIESPPLAASIELLIDSAQPTDYGIFKQLAERVARTPHAPTRDALALDILGGRVRTGQTVLPVSERGFELLAALALLPAGTSKKTLATAIWPGLDGDGAQNALKMCISRTRAQIADKEAIASTKRGYSLSERVAVDVREIERLFRSARRGEALGEGTRHQIEDAVRRLDERERERSASWGWFVPFAAQLDGLRDAFALLLAGDAWREGSQAPARPVAATL